jgi:c-di-GMP-binding flagellar brake protein YcgR
MGLSPNGTSISVDGILRKCLVRDISFGGCKVLIPGVAKFLTGKPSIIKFAIKTVLHTFLIPGRILRADPVEGRKDIAVAAVQFDETNTPMDFKMKLNDVFRTSRK